MKKKSLIENLKSTRKANVVTAPAKNEGGTTRKALAKKAAIQKYARAKYARVVEKM
jgi:hypothetical protein